MLAIIGQVGTIYTSDFNMAVASRALAGIGEGLCLGIGFASLAQMRGGTKLLGLSSGISAAFCLIEFMAVPALHDSLGNSAVFWFLTAGYVVLLPLSYFLPRRKIVRAAQSVSKFERFNTKNTSLFVMCLLTSIGANSLWLYFDQIGQNLGLNFSETGMIGSLSMLCAILVPLIIGLFSKRLSGVIPLLIGCLLMATTCYLYVSPANSLVWTIVVIYMTFLYLFVLGCARMCSAEFDASGRTTAAIGSADVLGMVVGPMIVAVSLPLENSLIPLAYFATITLVLCTVPAAIILKSKKHIAPCCAAVANKVRV